MAYYNGRSYTDLRGLNLRAANGAIRFETPTTTPTTTSGEFLLYVNSSNQLVFDDGSSSTTLGAAGAVANFSLNDAYDDGSTITVDASSVLLSASISNPALQITQTGSGADITGTSSTWTVTKAGAATFTGVVLGDNESVTLGDGSDATIAWNGSVLNIAGVTDFDNNVTMAASATMTQAGVAGSTVHTITAGDMVMSDGSLAITDADVAATLSVTNTAALLDATSGGVVTIVADSVTTGRVIDVNADAVTSGTLLHLDTSAAGFSGNYIQCFDGAADDFTVGLYGAVTVAGNGGSNVLTLTAGDAVMSDGSLSITDADNAATVAVTNNTITTQDLIQVGSSSLTTGKGIDFTLDTMSTGSGIFVTADALTTGNVLDLNVTSPNALTTGNLISANHTSGNITGTLNKTSQLIDFVSTRTVTTGTVSDNFDMVSAIRTSVINGGGSFSSTGSVAYIENAVTNTSGTVTDTVKGIEVVMDSLGTGDGVEITHAATGAVALDVHGAATSVDDVLITTTGVKANNKAALQVTNSGATAAGGSVLRVINTGTPAAATSYLVDFDYSGATMTNNPVGVYIHGGGTSAQAVEIVHTGAGADNKGALSVTTSGATAAGGSVLRVTGTGTPAAATSYLVDFDYTGATFTNNPDTVHLATGGTGRALYITNSGLSATTSPTVEIESTNAGAVGAVLQLAHTGGSQAASDVVGAITFQGEDDAGTPAANEYGRIESTVISSAAGSESASMDFYTGDAGGGVTKALQITHDGSNGFVTAGDGAATAIVESNGNFDLQLQTGNATTGNITITDGANGNITLTPNGSGAVNLAGAVLHSETTTSSGPGAVAVTGGIHEITTTGADAITLADGTEGQVLFVVFVTDGGNATLTPSNPGGYSTITFSDAGDSVTLLFTNGKWYVVGQGGLTTGPSVA